MALANTSHSILDGDEELVRRVAGTEVHSDDADTLTSGVSTPLEVRTLE